MNDPVEKRSIPTQFIPRSNRLDGLRWVEARAKAMFWLSWLAVWAGVLVWARNGSSAGAMVVIGMAFFWPLVVPLWRLAVRAYLSLNQGVNARLPGAVPFGVPPAGMKGFGGLERNQHGAIDMAKYSDEQWLATRLDYCRKHMTGPQDARFRTVTDQYGNQFAADLCGCGQIVNLERLARAAQIDRRDMQVAVVGSAGAAIVSDLTGHKSVEDFAVGYGAGAVVENVFKQRRYRRLYRLLCVHPELDGVWISKKDFQLAQHPLPLHPPRYPQPTGFTPGGFWLPENPLSDGNGGAPTF